MTNRTRWGLAVLVGAVLGVGAALRAHHQKVVEELLGPKGPPPPPGALVAPSGDRPNIVLVIGCTVRRDQTSPYGGVPATTPFLQEVADHGVKLADAVTASSWTRASTTAIVTGMPFRAVGMAEPAPTPSRRRLAPAATTLAEILKSAGYLTYGATSNPNTNRVFGFDQGFDWYSDTGELFREGLAKIPGARVVDSALAAIDQRSAPDPVFLQLLLLDAHQPGKLSASEVAQYGGADDAPERVKEYRALLHRFDRSVQRLWNGLADRGFDDTNTVLVVVNDHGEGLQWPADNGVGHGNFLYPSTTGMVWLARGRGIPAGRTVPGMAGQIDVLPTLAALGGAPGYVGPGHDLSAALRGEAPSTGLDRAFADTDYQRSDKSAVFTPTAACELNRRFDPAVERCWDRVDDPWLRKPLKTPDAALLGELRAWRADVDAAAAAWGETGDAALSDRERQQLDAIGYVQGDDGRP